MLIAYDNVFRLPPDKPNGTQASVDNHGARFHVSLRSSDFRVEYDDGRASIQLYKDFTITQARELAAALLKRADEVEAQDTIYSVFTMQCIVPKEIDPQTAARKNNTGEDYEG